MRRVMAMSLAFMLAMPAVAQDQIGGGETEIGNGTASYYGRELAGNRTASGERFDPDQMTAAHPTLAFGSKVRVTNLSNGQSVIVRVNDRGPFGGRRVIDISQAAAKEIGMHRSGTAKVSLTLVADQD
ncbi:septal ring lytic transglycosylase RlpA family protein [Sphingopyxis terrae subsp. terrae]|nr:septal ring lytic transglycosylase RlpA family protein [Sphingopyxis terrae subsp. terrae]